MAPARRSVSSRSDASRGSLLAGRCETTPPPLPPSRGSVDDFTKLFSAWRTMRLGSREVIDGLVAPEHRGSSPALAAVLAAWPGAHYWADPDRTRLVLIRPVAATRPPRWFLHAGLVGLTILCSLAAGAALAGAW